MVVCTFSNLKGEVCIRKTVQFGECDRDIPRNVRTYGLGLNCSKIRDKIDLILCCAGNMNKNI